LCGNAGAGRNSFPVLIILFDGALKRGRNAFGLSLAGSDLPSVPRCDFILLIMRLLYVLILSGLFATLAQGQAPELDIDHNGAPVRVTLQGQPGADYTLQGCDTLAATNWDFLVTLSLTNQLQSWFDSSSTQFPQRFYRALKLDSVPPQFAQDFRLIDHNGRTRSLFYYAFATNVKAFVLIFTGNGCSNVHRMLPTIKALRDVFTPRGVLFWMIDANRGDTRSNILAEATALGIDLPILHDRAQLVARTYQATTTPEAICIGKPTWTIFYRGQIDDRIASNTVPTTQSYLSNALSNFLAGRTVSPNRSRESGCDITFTPRQEISYSSDIAPLLQNKCVSCHRPGNIAPWSMTNYDIVQIYAPLMRGEILAGRMPPWHADPHYGTFANDSSLSPAEAAMLVQWIDDGAPRGTGPDPLTNVPPPPPTWALGTPTNILTIPVQNIPANGQSGNGKEPYHYVNVTTTFSTDVWIRAAVVRPDNVKIVHHCLVYFGTNSQLAGMDGFFAGYVPGYDPVEFPAGTAKFLPRGAVLRFQMHYITSGSNETDRTQLGLYTTPAPPAYVLQTRSAYNWLFSIPPGAPDYEVTAQYGPFPRAVYLYEMSPHMHLRGSRFKYEAVYSNNTRETLLSVPFYEFHWQTLYRLSQPKLLPAGTKILCTGAWDNSVLNLENPNPNVTVTFGEQTDDEMFIGYFNFAEIP
jgi:hypothetical protein